MARRRVETARPRLVAENAPSVVATAPDAGYPAISEGLLDRARVRTRRQRRTELRDLSQATFQPMRPARGVVPSGAPRLAADEAPILDLTTWAADNYFTSAYEEGMTFLGYAYLSALSQRAEYRVVSETIATEATREWIEIKSAGDDKSKSKVIGRVRDELENLNVQEVISNGVEHDGLFGRAHLYLDTGHTDDADELRTDLGDGRDARSRVKVGPENPLRAVRTVEPAWTYPQRYNTSNPLDENWYRPEAWYVMGREVHRSRLLTMVGRPVSDMLKPAYGFGGLSMSQMLKPYVDNWLRTRQSVSDITHGFSIPNLGTNLDALLKAGGGDLLRRADLFNVIRDNRSLMLTDKDSESFQMVQASLGTLDQLQAQAQEQMAAIARIPLVKLLGISPHGLNASSEGELRAFYDWVKSFQKRLIRPVLQRIFWFVQLSLFGKVDPDLTFDFLPLWQLDELQRAQVNSTRAQTYASDVNAGIVDPDEVREAYRTDQNSQYAGLDLEGDAPGPPGGGTPGLDPNGGGDPLAASEDDGDDPDATDRVDSWRRKAAALFADEEETDYWARRAAEMFGNEVAPGRWSALAAKLALTTNQPEPIERWARRAARWADVAAELEAALAEPVGANVEPEQPVSELLPEGSGYVRWDREDDGGVSTYAPRRGEPASRRYRDAAARIARNVQSCADVRFAGDAAEGTWSEEQHPRDPTGKFAKAGFASPKIVDILKKHGYEKHPDFPGTEVYHHPETGHHVAFKPLAPTELSSGKKSTVVKHLPPKGKPSPWVLSSGGVNQLMTQLHGGAPTFETSPAESPPTATEPPLIATTKAVQVNPPASFGEPGHVNSTNGAKTYQDAARNMLTVMRTGKWQLHDKKFNKLAEGTGQADLDAAIENHLPKDKVDTSPPAKPEKDLDPQVKAKIEQMPPTAQQIIGRLSDAGYELQADTFGVLVEKNGKQLAEVYSNGSWSVTKSGVGVGVVQLGNVDKINQLNAAIWKHHGNELGLKAVPTAEVEQLPAPFDHTVQPPKGFDLNSKDGKSAYYKTPDKEELHIFNDGSWILFDKIGNLAAEGYPSQTPGGTLAETQKKLNDAFEALHPRGEGGKFEKKNAAGTPLPPPMPPSPTASKTGSVGAPLDPTGLKKVGEQKGSNPGGVYQDEKTGGKYYVKFTPSPDHARNELLAARLYQLAGAPTLSYHPAGDEGVATDWDELKATNANQLTDAQRKVARGDFATHAWLANWDAVGLNNDNVGVNSEGVPVSLDLGGALKYRAKGTEKGAAFGNAVNEWDMLRDASKNPTSAAFFKDMTPEEIAASVKKLMKFTNSQIAEAVGAAGYVGSEAEALTKKLIARREDVIARATKEVEEASKPKAAEPAEPEQTGLTETSAAAVKKKLSTSTPPRSNEVKHAISEYKGSGYDLMNACARFLDDCEDDRVIELDKYLAKTSLPATTLYRGIPYDKVYVEKVKQLVQKFGPGRKIPDQGFVSTSTHRAFSDGWRGKSGSGGLLLEIEAPEGFKGTVVHPNSKDHEYEVLLPRGCRFVVKSYDPDSGVIKVTLDQSKINV